MDGKMLILCRIELWGSHSTLHLHCCNVPHHTYCNVGTVLRHKKKKKKKKKAADWNALNKASKYTVLLLWKSDNKI